MTREQEIREGVDYLFGGSFVWSDELPDDPYQDLDREHGWFIRTQKPRVIIRRDGEFGDATGTLVGYAKGYGEIYEFPFSPPPDSFRYMGSLEEQLEAELEYEGLGSTVRPWITWDEWEAYKASCDSAYNEWDGTGNRSPAKG